MYRYIFIILLFLTYSALDAARTIVRDEDVPNLITIITTTNPTPSMPSTKLLYSTNVAIFRHPSLLNCKKIIVFDGIQDHLKNRAGEYQEYKRQVRNLVKYDKYFQNTKIIELNDNLHLRGALRAAMKQVTTPFVYIHQHDLLLIKNYELNDLLATMIDNPTIKHLRLSDGITNDLYQWWDGDVDEKVSGPSYIPMCRCFGWSARDHFARSDYYRDMVLTISDHPSTEGGIHNRVKNFCKDFGKDACIEKFGTFLYGNIKEGGYIIDLDGRFAE